jgi:hypothetical protein
MYMYNFRYLARLVARAEALSCCAWACSLLARGDGPGPGRAGTPT